MVHPAVCTPVITVSAMADHSSTSARTRPALPDLLVAQCATAGRCGGPWLRCTMVLYAACADTLGLRCDDVPQESAPLTLRRVAHHHRPSRKRIAARAASATSCSASPPPHVDHSRWVHHNARWVHSRHVRDAPRAARVATVSRERALDRGPLRVRWIPTAGECQGPRARDLGTFLARTQQNCS